MILLRMAIATVCVRLTAPSLPAAFARCCSAVRWVMFKISPISHADLPCEAQATTAGSAAMADRVQDEANGEYDQNCTLPSDVARVCCGR